MARDEGLLVINNLTGGLATRPSPLIAEGASIKRMQSPNMRNVDLFNLGSISKRLGKTKQGSTLISSTYASQTSDNGNISLIVADGAIQAVAQKITTGASFTPTYVTVKAVATATGTVGAYVRMDICANNAGSPGTVLASSQTIAFPNNPSTASYDFVFATPPTLSAATIYFFVLVVTGTTGGSLFATRLQTGASTNVSYSANYNVVAWANAVNSDLYYIIYGNFAVQGIYDYRYGSASTQKVIGVVSGNIYWNNAGTWTSLISGLSTGQDNLYSFATLKDYLFTMDNGTNPGRVWNGTASYTTKLGFQATYSSAPAAGGAVTAGVYKLLAVTTLTSGGYRASDTTVAAATVTTSGGNLTIALTSIVADGTSASNFGFDIGSTATKWFMTAAGGSVYYKIPSGNMSVANPMPNNTTAFNITAITGLTAANTLLDEYGLQQAYFTTQIASPTGKYLEVFQNMLCMAGDANYPSRVWFSGIADGTNLAGPQIWSTNGDLYGNYRDLEPNDGEVLIGLKEWNGNLYAFKRHSVFLIAFTGVSGNPFEVRRLSGNLGALSHWSIKETPNGLAFISERGPALCSGTTINIIPAASSILNKFDLNDTTCYNLAAMQYTTAGNNSTKMQIHWGVSSHSATTRDITLVYDYEKQAFWENDVSANVYSEVTDSNFFPSVWSGDYSAQIFRMDYGTNDNGAAISWLFETPNISFGKPFSFKTMDHIFISGSVQSTGTLNVSIYTDMSSTAQTTRTINMADPSFIKGMMLPLNLTCTYIRIQLSNSELDVPVQINDLGFAWQDKGLRV